MSLNALLHLRYAQHVSGTSMPIIRSSRLYVCYYRLWCTVLGCWLSGVRCRTSGCRPGRGMLHDWFVQHPSCPKHVERIISAIKHSVTSIWFFFSTHMQRCTDKNTSTSIAIYLFVVWFDKNRRRIPITHSIETSKWFQEKLGI